MSDDQPRSGSRWEPPAETRPLAADSPASPPPGSSAPPSPAGAAPEAPAGGTPGPAAAAHPSEDEARPFRRRRPRALTGARAVRPKVAAGVAAVALASAAGGFVLGSALGSDATTPVGFGDGGRDHHGGFERDGDRDVGGPRGGFTGPDGEVAPPPGTAPGEEPGALPEGDDATPPPVTGDDEGATDGAGATESGDSSAT
ncbi:hypothetical protein G7072_00750 [Nocardioides sp. HDW12B]|uniref:hypothetical protein n=1 Tax=Nocardioides sp. HDW12B TaxID=2714939 RepID=UPI00140BD7DE|nr:hypothetical protein [Nocardioides sp. HDW12B]QIK65057.1 hypothetical protein G7072_00750 [Nocardioides sp. HDW12B]